MRIGSILKYYLIAIMIFVVSKSFGQKSVPGYMGKRFYFGVEAPMMIGIRAKYDYYKNEIAGNVEIINRPAEVFVNFRATATLGFVVSRK